MESDFSDFRDIVIAIVGLGQIGGSFALALRESKIGKRIIGVDRKEVVSEPGIEELVDETTSRLPPAIEEADFIFLSTPVLTILDLIPRITKYMKPGAILLDSGSTKKAITLMMQKHPDRILIGGHPMAGTEKGGYKAASPFLFRNRVFATIFPTSKSYIGRGFVFGILEKIGAIPLEIDAERHDLIVSLTSHLPYVLSLTLSFLANGFLKKDPLVDNFIAGGFLGATRLSLTEEEVGTGILRTNHHQIVKMIDAFQEKLSKVKWLIEEADQEKVMAFLSQMRGFRSAVGRGYDGCC